MTDINDLAPPSDLTPDQTTVLDKIQKLVDKAADPACTEHERLAFLAKADELMLKWSLDEGHLQDPDRPRVHKAAENPSLRNVAYFDEAEVRPDKFLIDALQRICYSTFTHMHVRIGGYHYGYMKVVGFPTDLDWAQMLYLSIKLELYKNLDPKVETSLPWEESLIAMKRAGFKWEAIHQKLQIHPFYDYKDQPWERKMGVRFTGMYKRWSDANPEAIRNMTNPDLWRREFADAFVQTVTKRMASAREITMEANPNLPALLNDRKSVVEEAFYAHFPEKRPHTATCQCDNCHWMKCYSDTCRKPVCVNYRKNQKSLGRSPSKFVQPTTNNAAREAGRRAGNTVDINNPHVRTTSAPRKELG